MAGFVHLHAHTEYSLLDGLSKSKKMLAKASEMGMDAMAITDHGVMYGAIEFYQKAQDEGIKPIIGIESYITDGNLTDRPERGKVNNYHLLLLAKDEEGYKNLMKIASIAQLEGYHYRPRIDHKTLEKYSKGVICTSACALGEVAQALINDDYTKAKKTAKWYADVFGKDYYLELQRHEYHKFVDMTPNAEIKEELSKMVINEKKINEGNVKLSRDLAIPIIATNDSHYTELEDANAQDTLVCVATNKLVTDTKRIRFIDNPSFYLKSEKQMRDLFPDYPEALDNTVKIAKKCNLKISTLGKWFFPKFDLPENMTAEEQLTKQTQEGLANKYKKPTKVHKERIKYELGIINSKGYAPYFLIMMDLANWCEDNGIFTNTRGSAAGSLVSYVLGITSVDPVELYLPFERFLNPFRPSPPDIDFDVPDNRREDIINYIKQKYGEDKVAQICTFGRMLARAAVRDVARVLGYPYATGDKISKLIPPPKQGFPINIQKALDDTPELKELYDNDADAKKVLDLASQVEGSARHISVHAAAVVVSPKVLTEFTPLQNDSPNGEKIITQYEMHACEDVGLIKLDILGIRNLAILSSAIKNVKNTQGKNIDIRQVPIDDKKTFDMLGRGETMGVFQLGSAGMTKYIIDLKPERVEELMAMVALYRPGPIAVIPEYIERKRDPRKVKYLDPRMEKFLSASYGLIVYQDDLLFCAIEMAGYNWQEADKFRKAVGKKIPEEMAAQHEKFVKGIVENGQSKDFGEKLWNLFEPFQAYGFNKAHAASYGMVSYYTAYMKANYPAEYMCALLTAESNDTDKITEAIQESKRIKIKILPPDINESDIGFTIIKNKKSLEGKAIRFGLSAIKHVGEAAIESILEARKDGSFISFAHFLSKVDNRKVNKKVLESLIKVGAMSKFGNRSTLLASIDEIRAKLNTSAKNSAQQGLFSQEEEKHAQSTQILDQIPEMSDEQLQTLEQELLGLSLSAKPISEILSHLRPFTTHQISELTQIQESKKKVRIAAVVEEVRMILTKKNSQEMAFIRVQDDTGRMDLVVFPSIFKDTKSVWQEKSTLLIEGNVDNSGDTTSLLVDSVKQEADGKMKNTRQDQSSDTLYITIPKGVKINSLQQMKKLLTEHPGSNKVTLKFEGNGKEEIQLPIKVAWNETLSRMINAMLEPEPSSDVQ